MKPVCAMVLGSAVALVLTTGHGFAQTQQLEPMPWGPANLPANALVAKPAETVTVMPSQSATRKAAAKPVTVAATAEQPASPAAAAPTQPTAAPNQAASAPAQAAKKKTAAKPSTAAKKTAKSNQPAAKTVAQKQPPPLPVQAEAAQDEPGPLRRLWRRVLASVTPPASSAGASTSDMSDVFSTQDSQ